MKMETFDFNLTVNRNWYSFKEGVTQVAVHKRLENLKAYLEWVSRGPGWTARHNLFLSEELMKKMVNRLKEEISYCEFYLELQKRKTDPNFDKWVFVEKDPNAGEYDYGTKHDRWVRTNGRVKAIIELDTSRKMTKISIHFRNDSPALQFTNQYDKPELNPSHAKNAESVTKKTETYIQYADRFLKEHMFPQCNEEVRMFNLLKEILCVEK